MRSSVQNTLLILLASTSILATPIQQLPDATKNDIQVNSGSFRFLAKEPKAAASPTSKTTAAGATAAGAPCAPSVAALASGISSNIADQKMEVAALASVSKVLVTTPMSTPNFDSAKANLLTFVQNGIAIRENNQKITPPGNGATAGLATVAMAQMEELNLTMSLDASNLAASNATVAKLTMDFNGGIMQNMKNLAAAQAGCKLAATGTATTPKATAGAGTAKPTTPAGTKPTTPAAGGAGGAAKATADDEE